MAKRSQTFDRARRKRKAQQRLKAAIRRSEQEEQEVSAADTQAAEKPAKRSRETAEAAAEE